MLTMNGFVIHFSCPQSHRSNCLDDIPPISAVIQDVKEFYGKLPGQVIDRAEQCEMAFGDRFYPCPQRLVSNVFH